MLLVWNETTQHDAGIHSVLIEVLENSTSLNAEIPNLLSVQNQLSFPVLEFRAILDTVSCLPTSKFLAEDSANTLLGTLSFSALVLSANVCTVIQYSSPIRDLLNEMLQVGPPLFTESRIESFYERAQRTASFPSPKASNAVPLYSYH